MPGLADSRRWDILPGDASAERALMESCQVPAIVARTLAARGIATVE